MRHLVVALAILLAAVPKYAFAISGTASQITVLNGTIAIVTPLGVAQGGTGAATLTTNGVLYGNGTSAIAATAAGTATQVLHGGTPPTFGAVSLTADVSGILPFANGGTGLSTAADDTTLISSGAAWVASAIPNCTDTGGNHLNYTAGTNALSCGTTSGTSIFPVIGFGSGSDITTSQTVFAGFGGGIDLTEGTVQVPSPGATYKNLRCVNSTVQGTGGATHDIVITARVGACGSQSSGTLTCTIVGTAAANQACSDVANNAAPTAGQCIDFQIVTPSLISNNARVNCVVERTA